MKKNIIKYSAFLLLLMGLNSCVDLDLKPHNKVSGTTMWTTPDLAEMGIRGIYSKLRPTAGSSKVGLDAGLDRLGSEGIGATSQLSPGLCTYLKNYTKLASDRFLSCEWKFGYTIIHAANDAIANLNKAGLDEAKYEQYLCEAKFMRAWAYKRLNMFFQGVPMYTEPISKDECTKTQSSADEIWNLIIDDLTYCINSPHFMNNNLDGAWGRASKGAAYALRGMTYMWKKMYSEAAADFDKVDDCGYGLFEGEYIDIFSVDNEHSKEIIFSIPHMAVSGYSDDLQLIIGGRDQYEGWSQLKPRNEFVDSYLMEDGSKFSWEKVPGLEDYYKLEPYQREVFFLRNGLNDKLAPNWKAEAIVRIGEDVFNKYYLNDGNEERIRKAYEGRDSRLKQTCILPYDPYDSYHPGLNGGNVMVGKELRWPIIDRGLSYGDMWMEPRNTPYYFYKKFNENRKDAIVGRALCDRDWPIIRYTDVLLQYAEALTELDNIDEAIALVNEVRDRAHMPQLTNGGSGPNAVSGKEDMRDRVRYERRVELTLEGISFFDEMRWGTYKETKFNGNMEDGIRNWWGVVWEIHYYNDKMWPWSAPLTEIQMNPSLTKREGWTY